jgi:hypothetical protein
MATLSAKITDQDEPAVEVPSWSEVSSLPEFQNLSYPEQRRVALSWAEDVKREGSYRGEFTEADAKEVDDFVASAVQPDLETKAKAAAEGVIRGGLSGTAATLAGRAAFALPLPPIPRAIVGLGATAAAQVGVDELARRGIEQFAPGLTEAAELAPGYASGGQIAGIAGSAGPAVARTAQALGTIAKAEGGKAAVQQGARLLAPAAAIGAGVDTGFRAVTGQEITPGSVATGAILNTLFAGYGANTRVANFTRDEARGLFQRVMEGKGSLRDTDDLLAILNQMKQGSPEGMPMQDFGRAQRTTVDVLGKRAVDRTTLEQPTFRTPPADEAPLLPPRSGPDPVVQRTPELPEAGVRGSARGTIDDTGELQRRGITSEMEQSLQLDQPAPRRAIFTTESQGINRQAIIPDTRGLQGELVSEGPTITPRRQLPTTERLALTDAEPEVQTADLGVGKAGTDTTPERSPSGMPPIVGEMISTAQQSARNLSEKISNVKLYPYVAGQKTEKITFQLDGKTYEAELRGRNKDLMVGMGEKQDKSIAVRTLLDGHAKQVSKPSPIPRPFGKKGEAGFIDAKLATKPAELAKRYLATKGDLPKEMFDAMEARGSQTQAMLKQVDFTLRDLATEARKLNGKPQLTPEQSGQLDSYLRGEAEATTLPETLRPVAVQMRRQLDNLSDGLIQSGIFTGEKAEVVSARKGQYLTRSYEKFDNKNFTVELLKKRDPQRYAQAEQFVRNEIMAANPKATQAEIDGRIREIVEEGRDTPVDSMVRASTIGKDLGITKRRKDIPPEIRFLMGEYTDPVINYARSAGKMIHLYQTQRMLTELRDFGLKNGLFFDKPTGNATRLIAAEGSETRSPLNGLYAEPELVKAIESYDPIIQGNTVFELFSIANAAVKWGKTVGSVQAQFRNPIANVLIEIANGNFAFTGRGQALRSIWAEWGMPRMDTPEGRTYLKRATQLGVYDNSVFQEFIRMLKDAQRYEGDAVRFAEQVSGKVGNAATRAGRGLIEFGNRTYRAGDNFFKLMAWESETNMLMKGRGLSRVEAEKVAAERVKNTRPTYSRVPKAIKLLRLQPFIGNFISWPSEMLRNGHWALRYAVEDMATPGMRGYGLKRALGVGVAAFTAVAVARLAMAATGINDRKVDALRRFVPRYQVNATLMPTGQGDGEINYIDISYTDPYEIMRGPANAVLAGRDLDDSFFGATKEFLETYVGPSILLNSVISAYYGKTPQGREVRNPQDTRLDQTLDTLAYVLRQNEPATASQLRRVFYAITDRPDENVSRYGRVYKPSEELSALLGIRPQSVNIGKALEGKASRFNTQMSDVSRLFTEAYGAVGTADRERIVAAGGKMRERRQELFDEANKDYHAAMLLGLTRSEAISAMRAGGISEDNAIAISRNKYTDYQISRDLRQTMKETLKPDELRKREAIARELRINQR